MSRIIYILLLSAIMGCASVGERLILSPKVEKVIKNLSHNFQIEAALCLEYERTFYGAIYVKDFYFPKTYRSTQSGVTYKSCPARYRMMWHNHPAINLRSIYLWKYLRPYIDGDIKYPWQLVYMSGVDLKGSNNGRYDIVMVSTNEYIAWWHKRQFTKAEGKKILFPIDGQTASL